MKNSEVKKQQSSIFIVTIGIIVSIGRYILEDVNADSIVIFMAIVNIIALGIVVLFAIHNTFVICQRKIQCAGIHTNDKKNRTKYTECLLIVVLLLYAVFGIVWMNNCISGKTNDILSIVTLALSIAGDGVAELMARIIYYLVKKVSRKSKENVPK